MLLYRMYWDELEYEEDWGVSQRNDGASFHLTLEDAEAFEKAYWKSLPPRVNGKAPAIYDRPSSAAGIMSQEDVARLPKDLIDRINKSENGVRLYRSEYWKIFS